MKIPFWQRDEAHPTRAIDRVQHQRSSRKIIGVDVEADFSRVHATMVLIQGVGKYARAKPLFSECVEVEPSARSLLQEISAAKQRSDLDFRFASEELGCFQSDCIKGLMLKNGISKNDVVTVGILDPGAWATGEEGRRSWRSFTDANRISHQTSLTIIDRFSERDLADGGSGFPLLPLSYWFLFADRHEKIAEENRVFVRTARNKTELVWLPASDGLDAIIPEIKYSEHPAVDSSQVNDLVRQYVESSKEPVHRIIDGSSGQTVQENSLEGIQVSTLDDFGFTVDSVRAAGVALLANSFIDQLPMSIPELTGNPCPRVLGCLTPGSIVNFRRFVLETSKVTPTVMKLRDAI
ncbi:MAG: anhydro-N-acetylmuramic acid kinase [Pirellulaceae bacterium]|nr:anhydro-N-acetylmuramic acid kinase [Pirellulaceae bacterium]